MDEGRSNICHHLQLKNRKAGEITHFRITLENSCELTLCVRAAGAGRTPNRWHCLTMYRPWEDADLPPQFTRSRAGHPEKKQATSPSSQSTGAYTVDRNTQPASQGRLSKVTTQVYLEESQFSDIQKNSPSSKTKARPETEKDLSVFVSSALSADSG